MEKPDLIRLSQSHLNLLSICPPKFQQVYLDGLGSIPDSKQQESMQWGSRFHLLMQQRELTLPIASLLETDSELDRSFKGLIEASPYLLEQNNDLWREAEHYRTLIKDQFLFTVIYDLLILKQEQAIILDWKTYSQPVKLRDLANNWQTRLYLYVLANTSDYSPEQIQMTYWFVKADKPQSRTINYTQAKHRQTEKDLNHLLSNLITYWENYLQLQTRHTSSSTEEICAFPHRLDCQEKCPYRQIQLEDKQQKWQKSMDEIEEIVI
ncbi:hypothetical protein NIES4102_23500 [Chondrocystis sp. NIES-4102]|nr:hypothetical protein NIES4102_23500 [Chondrocystis sp. NIES-4102]